MKSGGVCLTNTQHLLPLLILTPAEIKLIPLAAIDITPGKVFLIKSISTLGHLPLSTIVPDDLIGIGLKKMLHGDVRLTVASHGNGPKQSTNKD